MVNKTTDFFKITDNFVKTEHVASIHVIEAKLDYIPKVTIAIPTYKRAYLLKETIDSAIAQIGYGNYDIIIVDNNAERGCETEKLLLSFCHPKLSYYKNEENIGIAGNWNRCFELAKGEYVVLLHDDDLIEPDFLSECMQIIGLRDDIGMLKPEFLQNSKNTSKSFMTNFKSKKSKITRIYDFSNFFGFAIGAPTGCLFKKKNFISLGGFNEDYYPSFDFCFAVLFSKWFKVYRLNKELIHYRIIANNSKNYETINSCFHNDYYFLNRLMSEYHIPQYMIDSALSLKFLSLTKMYQTNYNSNFKLDLTQYNLTSTPSSMDEFNMDLIRIYRILLKLKAGFTEQLFKH